MLGADTLAAGGGGIGRVARLMAQVLADEAGQGLRAGALTLRPNAGDAPLPALSARGSQLAFAAACQAISPLVGAFLFDFAGIARARPRLPGARRPFLTWLHGIEVWERARPDHLASLQHAAVLLSNSSYTRERAAALHPALAHAEVCWLGTEQDEPAAAPASAGPPAALILGRIDAREAYKGHDALIDAWPRVLDAVPDARLLVAGAGSGLEPLRQRAAASPAASAIEWLGFVPEAAIESVWRRATVLAMPSRGEGFGLTYVEAMRRALPVIASTHDAAQEINVDGITGFNVDLAAPHALADRLIECLRDPAASARLGAAGLSRWSEHFRYTAFRERFRPHLARLLA